MMRKSAKQVALALVLLIFLSTLLMVVPSAKAATGSIEIDVASPGDAAAVTAAISDAETESGTMAGAMTAVTVAGAELDYNGLRQLYASLTALETLYMPTQITLPTGTPGVFQGHSTLRQINLPAVQTLGENAFRSCANLESLSLPLVQTVAARSFQDCTNLEIISLPQAQVIGPSAFEACPQLTSISIPKIQTLGRGAFYGGANGTLSITLPDTLTDFGADTFGNAMAGRLASVVFAGATPSTMRTSGGVGVFGNPASIIQVWVPSGAKAAYDGSLHTVYNHVVSTSQIKEYPDAALSFATNISATPATLTLSPGQSGQLSITVSPANATDKSYYFTSSNNAVASISGDGVVFANAPGTTVITVTSSMQSTVTGTCTVTILGPPVPTPLPKPTIKQPAPSAPEKLPSTGENKTEAKGREGYLAPISVGYNFSAAPAVSKVTAEALSGRKIKLSVSATSTDGSRLLYQWQVQNEDGSWRNIGGANGSVYTASKLKADKEYTFRCLVKGYGGASAYSDAVKATAVK